MTIKHQLAYTLLPAALGVGLLGANMVSAYGFFGFGTTSTPDQMATRQQLMFQNEANLLGISVDAVKAGWAQGKTLSQIAADNGITADQLKTKVQDAQTQQIKAQLQTLVDKGIITQAQADQRLQFMQNRPTKGFGRLGRGFHRGFWF